MNRATRFSLIFMLILAACSTQAFVFTESGADGMQPGNDASLKFVVQPYIQNVTPSGVTLMWQTNALKTGKVSVTSAGRSDEYTTKASRCLAEVRVVGLSADTVYTYEVEVDGLPVVSSSFKTFPKSSRPVMFTAYGDSRSEPERHAKVIDAMAGEKGLDFVLHDGDVVTSGRPHEFVEEFFTPAAKVLSRVPVFAAIGNHENNSPDYFRYFSLPGDERWYSFSLPDIHVIALDSCSDFSEGSKQYQWLIADLMAHRDVKWKFVILHHPVYSSGSHGGNGGDGKPREKAVRVAQELLPKLAKQYGIAAVISGHDHHYERSTVDGVNYVVTGGGGAPGCKERDAEVRRNRLNGVVCGVLHYCLFSIDGDKAAMQTKTIDGKVIDTVELSSGRP